MNEGGPPKKEFVRQAWFDQDELVGARWWNESFAAYAAASPVGRRALLAGVSGGALARWLIFGGGAALGIGYAVCSKDDDKVSNVEALELQRREGWDVGSTDKGLALFDAKGVDAKDGVLWSRRLTALRAAMHPPEARLAAFEVGTLFQSLGEPSSNRLREVIRPVYNQEMEAAFARGRAIADLAGAADAPTDLALIVDLPGPQSVALAAGLAPRFAPVFTFDNWPHPQGVVPSHVTLGACLYYLPIFEEANAARPPTAMPAFVLDAARLNPYTDSAWQFDNRYMAPLPSAEAFGRLGVKRILYVRPDAQTLTELDDLNGDFVELERAGIQVRAVALSDFVRADAATGTAQAAVSPRGGSYYYGGHPQHHTHFWWSYGWGPGPRGVMGRPMQFSPAPSYRPTARSTIFSTRSTGGAGRPRPSGFGFVSYHSGGGSSSSGRSGSFGRSRSSSSG
jgi:hypothetical protein